MTNSNTPVTPRADWKVITWDWDADKLRALGLNALGSNLRGDYIGIIAEAGRLILVGWPAHKKRVLRSDRPRDHWDLDFILPAEKWPTQIEPSDKVRHKMKRRNWNRMEPDPVMQELVDRLVAEADAEFAEDSPEVAV